MTIRYGMSETGRKENAAKVAIQKAKLTNDPADWREAARLWDEVDFPDKADYCEQMAAMLDGLKK